MVQGVLAWALTLSAAELPRVDTTNFLPIVRAQIDRALKYYARAREGAVARGQSQMLTSIDRDLKLLEP